jgi:NAD(P)H-dependent FMN reductase
MYIIISGTNRADSNTMKIAEQYRQMLIHKGIEPAFLSLQGVNVLERNPAFEKIEQELLIPARKFIFISPEYNGSIPGVLKAMFDISEIQQCWWGKKALLTGVSTGRAGNLRGMDHLTGILNYLKVVVHPNKLPLSMVSKLFDASGAITDLPTLQALHAQVDEFIAF